MKVFFKTQDYLQEMIYQSTRHEIALVPTMGCLHPGHLSLVEMASQKAPHVSVSIFVNPRQFGAGEDLDAYPRQLEQDLELLRARGVSSVLAPQSGEDFYGPHFQTPLLAGPLAQTLCGSSRPGHFDGVLTVCLKLFLVSRCSYAVFGEKDFQQLRLLEQLVEDYGLGLQILRAPLVREPSGLAMSSRNKYLSPRELLEAPQLYQALHHAQSNPALKTVGELRRNVKSRLPEAFCLDYLEIAQEKDLVCQTDEVEMGSLELPRVFVAARLGRTRLIDNLSLTAQT